MWSRIGGKAKIEENPPMQRRKKQAELGKKLKKEYLLQWAEGRSKQAWSKEWI